MKLRVFPNRDGGWSLDFVDPTAAELGLSEEEFEAIGSGNDFPTSGEARRAGKKVVRAMHHYTSSVEIEILEEAPEDA